MYMYLQKVNSKKLEKNLFFVDILKATGSVVKCHGSTTLNNIMTTMLVHHRKLHIIHYLPRTSSKAHVVGYRGRTGVGGGGGGLHIWRIRALLILLYSFTNL